MPIRFEWDSAKAIANRLKHNVDFDEACSVFGDPRSLTETDKEHSFSEERFQTVGRSRTGRLLVVVHTDRGSRIRIISARRATRREQSTYEEDTPRH